MNDDRVQNSFRVRREDAERRILEAGKTLTLAELEMISVQSECPHLNTTSLITWESSIFRSCSDCGKTL